MSEYKAYIESNQKTDSVLLLDRNNCPCLNCGGITTYDLECTECEYDNIDWYLMPELPRI